VVIFRDFNWTYPDFERYSGSYISFNLAQIGLDSDQKPVATGCCIDTTNNCYNTNPLIPSECVHVAIINGEELDSTPSCDTAIVNNGKTISTPYGNVLCQCSGSELCELTSPSYFYHWYRDTAGINLRRQLPIRMLLTGNTANEYFYNSLDPQNFSYVKDGFYPLSEDLWQQGNYGNKNFAFTTEIKIRFPYLGGEHFEFSGDDDVYVFVNNRLALDIGGLHPRVACEITGTTCQALDLDASAESLGITLYNYYDLHVFHAERHTTSSNFWMTTNIQFLNGGINTSYFRT